MLLDLLVLIFFKYCWKARSLHCDQINILTALLLEYNTEVQTIIKLESFVVKSNIVLGEVFNRMKFMYTCIQVDAGVSESIQFGVSSRFSIVNNCLKE